MPANIKMTLQVETALLKKKIAQIQRKMPKVADKIIDQSVIFFVQSAVKNTPPGAQQKAYKDKFGGYKTVEQQKTIKKRSIIKQIVVRDRDGSLRAINGKPKGRGKLKKSYSVPYRTSRKKGVKVFPTLAEAKTFAKIKYRYIGKASWVAAAEKAGIKATVKKKFPSEVIQKAREFTSGKKSKAIFTGKASASLRIGSRSIDRFTARIGTWAIAKTKNRLWGWAKAEMRKAMKVS